MLEKILIKRRDHPIKKEIRLNLRQLLQKILRLKDQRRKFQSQREIILISQKKALKENFKQRNQLIKLKRLRRKLDLKLEVKLLSQLNCLDLRKIKNLKLLRKRKKLKNRLNITVI